MAETGQIAYGVEKFGKWTIVSEGQWDEQTLEPLKVYEFNYLVPEVPFWKLLGWIQVFDPMRYVSTLREEVARKMAVTPQEIQIPWFYYNPDDRQFRVQLQYIPGVHGEVGFAILTIFAISTLIISVTGLVTMMGALWKEIPVLQIVREMKEGVGELGKVMKYVVYAILAGGSLWLAAKYLPKLGKKERKKVEPAPVKKEAWRTRPYEWAK